LWGERSESRTNDGFDPILTGEHDMTKTEESLLKELRAARTAIRKMKFNCNHFDEGYEIGASALKRLNGVIKEYRQPVAKGSNEKLSGREEE
jgi:hypothetical protein